MGRFLESEGMRVRESSSFQRIRFSRAQILGVSQVTDGFISTSLTTRAKVCAV